MKASRFLCGVLLCLSVSVHGSSPLQRLVADLESMRVRGNVPVLAVGLLQDGRPILMQVLGRGADAHTPLRWGSISKTFTALALSHAVDARGLAWDAPVAVLEIALPWNNPWRQTQPVRFRHLAELCAGTTDLSMSEFHDNVARPLREVLKVPREIRWPPGLQQVYSNVTPGLSAWVVEQLSGRDFETYMRASVFEPLDMMSASLGPVPGLPGGFRADGVTEIPYWHMTFPAAGGMNASLAEVMGALTRMLDPDHATRLPMDRLLDPGCAGRPGARPGLGYGAGMYGRVRNGFVFHGHGGDADGYRSRYGLLMGQRRGYVVLINTDNPGLLRGMERRIEGFLTRDLTRLPSPTPSTGEMGEWAGNYYPSGTRFGYQAWRSGERPAITVAVQDERLRVTSRRGETVLFPVDRNRFRRSDDPVPSVVFFTTQEGTFMQGELGAYVRTDTPCPSWVGAACAQESASSSTPHTIFR